MDERSEWNDRAISGEFIGLQRQLDSLNDAYDGARDLAMGLGNLTGRMDGVCGDVEEVREAVREVEIRCEGIRTDIIQSRREVLRNFLIVVGWIVAAITAAAVAVISKLT